MMSAFLSVVVVAILCGIPYCSAFAFVSPTNARCVHHSAASIKHTSYLFLPQPDGHPAAVSSHSRHQHPSTSRATPQRRIPCTLTPTSLSALSKRQSGMEVGIQTAQLLMDPRRHDTLKKSIQKRFPLVPGGALDACIDIAADAFKTVAPKKLKQALRPGGMDKVRPDIERSIVSTVMKQQVVKDIPLLSDSDKTKLMEAIVDVCLDAILDDAEEVLASPEVRLEALEEEIREVKLMMGMRRLWLYRVRNNPLPVAAALALSVGLAYWRREDRAMVAVTAFFRSWVAPAFAAIGKVLSTAVVFLKNKLDILWEPF